MSGSKQGNGLTYELNGLFRSGWFVLCALVLATATTLIGSFTSQHFCLPIGLGLGMLGAFTALLQCFIVLSTSLVSAIFVGLGIATTQTGAYSNLHANTAWYALAAFAFVFCLFDRWAGDTDFDSPIVQRLVPIARFSSLALVCFVPIVYGTGIAPLLVTVGVVSFLNLWAAEARWLYFSESNYGHEFLMILLLVVAVVLTNLWVGAVATAVINGLMVLKLTVSVMRKAEQVAGRYATA